MRRTLAVLVTAGAFLVPAGAASAEEAAPAPAHLNASCSNGDGGNYAHQTTHGYNGSGNTVQAAGCATPAGEKVKGWSKNHGGSKEIIVEEPVVVVLFN